MLSEGFAVDHVEGTRATDLRGGVLMVLRTKRLLVASAAVVGLAAILPVAPATAMAPCQVRSISTIQGGQTNVIAGAYTSAGATDVSLTCGIVRNGVTVARFPEKVPGPVATVAGTANEGGFFTVCHEIRVSYVDGRPPYVSDSCP
jgi:hypothetical protein